MISLGARVRRSAPADTLLAAALACWIVAFRGMSVALLILVEKALPGGEQLARASGLALVAAGTVMLT